MFTCPRGDHGQVKPSNMRTPLQVEREMLSLNSPGHAKDEERASLGRCRSGTGGVPSSRGRASSHIDTEIITDSGTGFHVPGHSNQLQRQ